MRTLLALGLLGLVASPWAAPEPEAKAFDEMLLRYAANGWTGSVLVARGGEVVIAGGYGFADFQADRPNAADTLFEIASITKSFTGVAVVKLDQQGKLDLDDSIAMHLPGVPEHSKEITVRHLLSHSSGIPRSNGSGRGEDLGAAVAAFLGTGPQATPGTKYEYWNGGYALLAGVIEQKSGRSYADYLEAELFAPAGMEDSGFTGDTDLPESRIAMGKGHDGRDRLATEHPYMSYGYQYRGMGGLVTTALDFLKWDRALAKGLILDEAHTRELFEPQIAGYALGWRVDRAVNGSPRQWHGGSVRGFVADFRRFPKENACIAVLCNDDVANPQEVAANLECLLFKRPFLTPPPKGEIVDRASGATLAGTYANDEGKMVVRAAPGVLIAGIEGAALLEKLGAGEKLGWKADPVELGTRAVEIVEAIARGDVEPLRTHVAKSIPKSWPDRMTTDIWPAQIVERGPMRSVRSIGALARGNRVEVLLELVHEQGPAHALVAFGPEGLEKLDWRGPQFLASARLKPAGRGSYLLMLGEPPPKLEFELAGGKARALRLAGMKLSRQ